MKITNCFKLYLLVFFTISTFSQNLNIQNTKYGDNIFKGKLTNEKFEIFKNFIRLTSEIELNENNSFIINYIQPVGNCFYDNYKENENHTVNWFEKNVYEKREINLNSLTLNLFYQAKEITNKKSKMKYDLQRFIYSNFMEKNNLCYGVLMINSSGEYRVLIGEYLSKNIIKFASELQIK
jgi:hypothetical protein